jgi:hypothetical protein
MDEVPKGTHVHPFPVRHRDSDVNSVFTQEGQFSRDATGHLAAPFSCFPPFRGETPFVVARGRILLSDETLRQLQAMASGDDLEALLADAIRRKLLTASNGGDLLIDLTDLPTTGPPGRQSVPES